jgi:hypothetical protein
MDSGVASLHNNCDCVALFMSQEFMVVYSMALSNMLFAFCITTCFGPHESLAEQLQLYLPKRGQSYANLFKFICNR